MENQSKPSKSVRILLYFLLASPLPHFVYVYVNVYRAYLAKGAEMWQSNPEDFGFGIQDHIFDYTMLIHFVGIAFASVLLLLNIFLRKADFSNATLLLYWLILLYSVYYFTSSPIFIWIVD